MQSANKYGTAALLLIGAPLDADTQSATGFTSANRTAAKNEAMPHGIHASEIRRSHKARFRVRIRSLWSGVSFPPM